MALGRDRRNLRPDAAACSADIDPTIVRQAAARRGRLPGKTDARDDPAEFLADRLELPVRFAAHAVSPLAPQRGTDRERPLDDDQKAARGEVGTHGPAESAR